MAHVRAAKAEKLREENAEFGSNLLKRASIAASAATKGRVGRRTAVRRYADMCGCVHANMHQKPTKHVCKVCPGMRVGVIGRYSFKGDAEELDGMEEGRKRAANESFQDCGTSLPGLVRHSSFSCYKSLSQDADSQATQLRGRPLRSGRSF